MSTITSNVLSGSCACRAIKYRVIGGTDTTSRMAHCHCFDCRKMHGAAFSTFARPVQALKWTSGEDELSSFRSRNGADRKSCRICGFRLTFEDQDGMLEFALSTLDPPTADDYGGADGASSLIRADVHVFSRSKVSWFTIQDELPQCEAGRIVSASCSSCVSINTVYTIKGSSILGASS